MSQGNADHTFCAVAGAVEKQHEAQLWLIKSLVIQPANRINKKKLWVIMDDTLSH
jgi:hypothetical protein